MPMAFLSEGLEMAKLRIQMFWRPVNQKQTTQKGICKDSTYNDLLVTAWHIYEKSKLVCELFVFTDKKWMQTVNQIHFYIFQ